MESTLLAATPLPAAALRDKTILVTGATRGLGRAIALECAQLGANLLLLGKDVRRLEGVADEIEALGTCSPTLIPFNLEGAQFADYETIGQLIAERHAQLHGLVLNAGLLGELAPLETSDPLLWARVFQINVHSAYLLLRECLPLLRAAISASVVFVSSSVGRQGRAYWGAYAASKFALEGMMQTLADEMRQSTQVRVNSLNPGRLRTRMRAQAYPAEDPSSLPEPGIVAPYFAYLLSDQATEHGKTLHISG